MDGVMSPFRKEILATKTQRLKEFTKFKVWIVSPLCILVSWSLSGIFF